MYHLQLEGYLLCPVVHCWSGAVGGAEATDGTVDLVDLARLMQFWLTGESSVDIAPAGDPDGIVNILDFAIIAENWTGN